MKKIVIHIVLLSHFYVVFSLTQVEALRPSTHFVIHKGKVLAQTTKPHADQKTAEIEVHFTRDGQIRSKLTSYINQEKEKISFVTFIFTDKILAKELIKAHKRGVIVEVFIDGEQAKKGYSNIDMLIEQGIPVWFYDNNISKKKNYLFEPIMHHKFTIFHGTQRITTGSSNATVAAYNHNCENMCSIQYHTVIHDYIKECELIKKDSTLNQQKTDKKKTKKE